MKKNYELEKKKKGKERKEGRKNAERKDKNDDDRGRGILNLVCSF